VPYNGGGSATTAVLAGRPTGIVARRRRYIKQQRALAVLSKTRFKLPPFSIWKPVSRNRGDNWVLIHMPKPERQKQIVTLLNREIARIVTLTDMKDRWVALGFEPVVNTPEEFAERIRDDLETWAKLIRAAGLKAE
jgi:tripartite-type tricarboxylate transporter receptor subunit TctC